MIDNNWTHKKMKRSNPFYQNCVDRFNKQYKNVAILDRIFINENDKVFAAEWRDKAGMFQIIGGIYPDIKKTVEFVD